MALPQYRDEVLVTLTSIDPPSSFPFPDRRFFLSREKPHMDIGRTSRRNSSLEAARNNAYFDSAVMSRDHAQLKLDAEKQKVYIKDVGSLHGTFKDGQRLSRNSAALLSSGDNIRFGISIDRGSEKFPPCVMEASLRFGSIDPEDRPKVFRVPDDSDLEDSYSDDEDESVRYSSKILRKVNVRPATDISSPSNYSPRYSPIDLTGSEQYPTSNVREEMDEVDVDDYSPPFDRGTAVLSSSPTKVVDGSDYSPPVPFQSGWLLGSEDQDLDIHLSDSTDMDTDSSADNESTAGDETQAASILSANLEDTDSEDEEFDGEEVFEEYIPDAFSQPSVHQETLQGDDATISPVMESDSCFPGVGTDDLIPTQEETEHNVQEETENAPCTAVGGMSYILNYPTPPAGQHQAPAGQSWWGVSSQPSLRLPSISEAVSCSHPPASQAHVDPKTVAEILGDKTGKHAYFAAREENRIHMRGPFPTHNEQHVADSGLEPATHALAAEAANEEPANNNAAEDFQGPETLGASGAKFLLSPIENIQVEKAEDVPSLDETSAYQFEMSKRLARGSCVEATVDETPKSAGKRTRIGIDDMLQAPDEPIKETAAVTAPAETPKKRKAGEISELSPGEKEEPEKKDLEKRANFLARSIAASAAAKRRRAAKMKVKAPAEPAKEPARKRLRHVAEAFGYVALGGVAVMTALIATAPTL